jgi:hydrogenase maturation protein HypF
MGRLFDAAAALLDICHYNSYEGECAIKLEQAAHQGKAACETTRSGGDSLKNEHFAHNSGENIDNILHVDCVKIDGIWQANGVKLLMDMYHIKEQYSKEILAYFFHQALVNAIVEMTGQICDQKQSEGHPIEQVTLAGGSFLNRILTFDIVGRLQEKGKKVYINEKVPCGDGGIALGQMYLATFYRGE